MYVFTPGRVPDCSAVPPDAAAYQSTVNPAGTVAEIDGMDSPAQYSAETGVVGAETAGQEQSGALNTWVCVHPDTVREMVTSVPAGIPVSSQLLPPVFAGVPLDDVGVPELTEKLKENVNKSGEQVGLPIGLITGMGFTTISMVVLVAHWPEFGVKVYVVVAVLFKAGLQVPVIPLLEVVGRGDKQPPEQIAATALNSGLTCGLMVMLSTFTFAHCPASGVKV